MWRTLIYLNIPPRKDEGSYVYYLGVGGMLCPSLSYKVDIRSLPF